MIVNYLFLFLQSSNANGGYKNLLLGFVVNGVQLFIALRMYRKYVRGKVPRFVDQSSKVFVITGSNTGIGFETAKALVKMNATVIMACRSIDKANDARQSILTATNCAPTKVIVLKLDLCGFDSVKKFVKEFKNLSMPLHGLINNAGIVMEERLLTQDGFEMVFTANHLSHFMLTLLLLPELEKTGGRVVNLTSSLHRLPSRFDFDNVMSEKSYEMFAAYSQSKLANVLFTRELNKRLKGKQSRVSCFAVHPGLVRTEFTKNMPLWMRIGNSLVMPLLSAVQKTPTQGAYCSVYAATEPSLVATGSPYKGGYFANSTLTEVSEAAQNMDAARKLWEVSEQLTGLKHDQW